MARRWPGWRTEHQDWMGKVWRPARASSGPPSTFLVLGNPAFPSRHSASFQRGTARRVARTSISQASRKSLGLSLGMSDKAASPETSRPPPAPAAAPQSPERPGQGTPERPEQGSPGQRSPGRGSAGQRSSGRGSPVADHSQPSSQVEVDDAVSLFEPFSLRR